MTRDLIYFNNDKNRALRFLINYNEATNCRRCKSVETQARRLIVWRHILKIELFQSVYRELHELLTSLFYLKNALNIDWILLSIWIKVKNICLPLLCVYIQVSQLLKEFRPEYLKLRVKFTFTSSYKWPYYRKFFDCNIFLSSQSFNLKR